MERFTDLQRLRNDLVSGNRLKFQPWLEVSILSQLERLLDHEVNLQNTALASRSIFCSSVQENSMREILDLATGMKEAIASLKQGAVDAKAGLASEINVAVANTGKVNALTASLKEANREVEAFLGESGSNFPTSTDSDTQQPDGPNKVAAPVSTQTTDINGVTLNKETGQ